MKQREAEVDDEEKDVKYLEAIHFSLLVIMAILLTIAFQVWD